MHSFGGKSSSKSLLLSPVDGARISSRFASKRMHPVLGYSRAHLGIDFAAPIGTPIYASGDGVITFVGWKGGYGKMVSIRHNSEFATNYGHMSRYSKSAKIGTRVKQREIIGYIGITGLSSGPHLHYELTRNGKKINPRSIKGIASKKLNNQEMKEFKQKVLEIEDLKIKS
jgi:murein DD-endopeptidase MepM/ murein hydrolase activator NlpD